MEIQNIDIIEQVERLAEACPWDSVDLWITRRPEGVFRFTAYATANDKFGFPAVWGHGDAPAEAVDELIKQIGSRDPELARKKKIAELKEKIEQLEMVVIGLPPYKRGRELGNGEKSIRVNQTVDV
jgi:hypothetical protein